MNNQHQVLKLSKQYKYLAFLQLIWHYNDVVEKDVTFWPTRDQRRSQEFDLGGYKLHDIEFVPGQGDKTTT